MNYICSKYKAVYMKFWILLFSPLIFLSCNNSTFEMMQFEKHDFTIVKVNVKDLTQKSVIISYDPECPVCLLYGNSMEYLSKTYSDFKFILVLSSGSDTALFKEKLTHFNHYTIFYDPENKFLKKIGTTTTPQTFVFSKDKTLMYNGAFDNRVKSLGSKSLFADSFYLKNAIVLLQQNKKPTIKKTQPIGCLIQ
jgi:hypothetical protein